MSVVKSKRKESKFEVLHNAYKLRKDVTMLALLRFGYKTKERPNESESAKARRVGFETWFIHDSRVAVIRLLRDLVSNIIAANSLFPINDAEWDERRLYQDRAIANCYQLLQELQYVIDTVKPDVNRFTNVAAPIEKEINLLKGWRKYDNKIRKSSTQRTASDYVSSSANFANVNNNGNANNNNASNTNGVRPDFTATQQRL